MKKVPVSVWVMGLILIGVLALVGLTIASQRQTFTDVKLPVEIAEYFDYQCPHCAEFYPTLKGVAEKYGDKVKITYKHYPFLNDNSFAFAYAAEAAREQGKFNEYHDAVMSTFVDIIHGTAQNTDMDPVKLAQKIGLDMTKFETDRNADFVQNRVKADKADGAKLGVTSTPTVYVYGKKVDVGTINTASGQVDYSVFTNLIDQLVQKAEQNTK